MRLLIPRLLLVFALCSTLLIACGQEESGNLAAPTAAPVFAPGPVGDMGMGFGDGPPPTPTAEPALPIEQLEGLTLTASVPAGGAYRVGKWLPVLVTVQNDGPDLRGEVRVSAGRGGASYAATLELPRGARKSAVIYTQISSFSRRLTVRMLRGGTQVAQQQLSLQPHPSTARIVALMAADGTSLRLPNALPDTPQFVQVALLPSDLPDRPEGLSSFDTLIMHDLLTAEFSDAQRAALRNWVARGGQLLISGGNAAARTLAGLPDELRPAQLSGVQPLPATSLLPGVQLASEVTLALATPTGGTIVQNALLGEASTPLLIKRLLGKGSTLLLAMPVNEPALLVWPRAADFWASILHKPTLVPPGFGPSEINAEQVMEGNIATALVRLPALALPSLTLLGGLLIAYIILIGPVTYLVLRRLDRQALGWLVVPIITVVFALLAYGVGFAQRGGDVVLNQISVLEPLDGSTARVRSFVGIFSPRRAAYILDVSDDTLLHPVSLQGPWDTSDQGGVFQQQRASNIDVPQWSMRGLIADTTQSFRGLDVRLGLQDGQLRGEIVNGTALALRDVVLVQDINVAQIGTLQPGERREIVFERVEGPALEARRTKFAGAPLSYLIFNEEIDMSGRNGGQPLPPETQLRTSLLDAMYPPGPSLRNSSPLLFAWLDSAPLSVNVPDQRVDRQQLTLVTQEITLDRPNGPVALGQGWFQRGVLLENPNDTQLICMGSQGIGANIFGQPAQLTLSLPRGLNGLQPDSLRLLPSADGAWPKDVVVELYDWQSGEWVAQPVRGPQPVAVEQPERFLSVDSGQLRARVSGQIDPNTGGGCVYLDASMTGEF